LLFGLAGEIIVFTDCFGVELNLALFYFFRQKNAFFISIMDVKNAKKCPKMQKDDTFDLKIFLDIWIILWYNLESKESRPQGKPTARKADRKESRPQGKSANIVMPHSLRHPIAKCQGTQRHKDKTTVRDCSYGV